MILYTMECRLSCGKMRASRSWNDSDSTIPCPSSVQYLKDNPRLKQL